MTNNSILYPNVTSIPGRGDSAGAPVKNDAAPGEFGKVFEQAIGADGAKAADKPAAPKDLSHVKAPLKFSAHATQRLQDRKIALDQSTMAKVSEAVDKAEAKGVDDTLVLTKDVALIVSVKNRTVITAMDRGSMNGNVFTNIDGAVIVG